MYETKNIVQKSFFKRTLLFFRPFWKYFSIVIALMLVGQVIGLLSPYLFGRSVDAVTTGNVRLTFSLLGGALFLTVLQSWLLSWIRENIEISKLDDNIEQAFSVKSLRRIFEYSIGQHINEHSGVKQSIVNKGQNALSQIMYTMLYVVLPNGLQALAAVVLLTIFDWRIGSIALVFVTVYIWVSYYRNKKYFPKIDELRKKRQVQSKLQSELYRNATLVISEGQEAATGDNYEKSGHEVLDFYRKTWLSYVRTYYDHKSLIILGQYVCLALGVYLILIGQHSTGMFVTLFAWTTAVFGNLTSIMNSQRQFLFNIVEIKKFYELLDIVPDIDPNDNGKKAEPFGGEIEFKRVSFAYPYRSSAQSDEEPDELEKEEKEDHAVTKVSFKIPAGAKVGFVGVSGSGKSTIVNLMRRYYDPTEGEILIDGVPLKEMNLNWLRSKIGNVEQRIDLFDRSIRDNILFGLPEGRKVTEKALKQAVNDASLGEFISKLKKHGLETVIGEGGIKVSGGERQRIGIARAFIKNPKILIFDEATSALDSINEKLIHDAINRGSQGRTTIIIAHRLSTIMDADIIFVVANGKIVGTGTHAELSLKNKEYKKLIENQILAG